MHFVNDFRDPEKARGLINAIEAAVDPARQYRFMEFCGGHTHVLSRWGLTELLPVNVKMIHGPGCPVCVLPVSRYVMAIDLALKHKEVILCTYGDTMRVPTPKGLTLLTARSQGADIRMVYSPADAVEIAAQNPDREVVFLAIGFETTTPATALAITAAKRRGITNFSCLVSHVLTPAAMNHILATAPARGAQPLSGIVGPAHVSTVIGSEAYRPVVQKYHIPLVIAGFEPLDMLAAILMLIEQVNDNRADVENEFTRAVTSEGNAAAIALMKDVFCVKESFEWRGLGVVPASALGLNPAYEAFDAQKKFSLIEQHVQENRACACPAILRGEKDPEDCVLFGKVCTPDRPIGACMVSSEGACAARYRYAPRRARHDAQTEE